MMISPAHRSLVAATFSACRRSYNSALRQTCSYDCFGGEGRIENLLAALSSSPHFADRRILLLEQAKRQAKSQSPPLNHAASGFVDFGLVTPVMEKAKPMYQDTRIRSDVLSLHPTLTRPASSHRLPCGHSDGRPPVSHVTHCSSANVFSSSSAPAPDSGLSNKVPPEKLDYVFNELEKNVSTLR